MIDLSPFSFNQQLLLNELFSRGIQLSYIANTEIVIATYGKHIEYLSEGLSSLIPSVYLPILGNKYLAKQFMKYHGFSVTPGELFCSAEIEKAIKYTYQIGYPIVLKPTENTNGNLVFANLPDTESFIKAFNELAQYTNDRELLVEKFYFADDYRFLVIGEQEEIAVVRRTLPYVIGNGTSTIRQLIDEENYRRMNPRKTCLCPIYIDDSEGKRILRQQGLSEKSILSNNQYITLRCNANVCWGAECANFLDKIHPSYFDLARKIHRLFPKSGYTSIDLLINDPTAPSLSYNYSFCEFNSSPGLSLHLMPSAGKTHNVVKSIVNLLFPETAL